MGRYKFNNRGTGTIFFWGGVIQGGGVTEMISPPPLELVPILKTYCKVFVTGTDHPPPPLVLVNVQEWGCFSIFRRADDVTQTMSKGGGGACGMSSPPPPPSENPVSAPVICVIFRANQPLCPPLTKAFPYAYVYRRYVTELTGN